MSATNVLDMLNTMTARHSAHHMLVIIIQHTNTLK